MKNRAFTLVEMIVSLALFAIVAVVALAALVKIIDANNKAQTIQAAVTSLSFSLDAMSRELRSGSSIHCYVASGGALTIDGNYLTPSGTVDCPPSGTPNLIVFQSSTMSTASPPCQLWYAYYVVSSPSLQLEKAEQPSDTPASNCNSTALGSFTPVVPSNVVLTSYQMSMSSDQFPLIFLALSGYAGNKEQTKTYFTVQTAASPRTP